MAGKQVANLSKIEVAELLCVYSALVLTESENAITVENLNKVITAAKGKVDPAYAELFVQAASKCNINAILEGASKAGPVCGGGGGVAVAAAPAEEKKVEIEEEEEEEADMDFDLFD